MTTYEKLIIGVRHRESTSPKVRMDAESQSDRARLIFSAPFRRLQRKAQVFPLESATAVRTRLTHSLEVASIGKYIAQTVVNKFHEKGDAESVGLTQNRDIAFVNMVETACLMHDIGNPPFGHFGEYAISDWFSKNGHYVAEEAMSGPESKKKIDLETFFSTKFKDFTSFDGNAQGLRVVTRLQGADGWSGMNLTYSQLGAYLKYVMPPDKINKENKGQFSNKPGYFFTELDIVKNMWDKLGMVKNMRHPLVYITEAADDIAYCLSDIEDGVEKRIVDEEFLKSKLLKEIEKYCDENGMDETCKDSCEMMVNNNLEELEGSPIPPFMKFKTKLINMIVGKVAEIYIENHDEIVHGRAASLISQDNTCYAMIKSMKSFAIKNIFRSREAEDIELGGYSVIFGLLEQFRRLLVCSRTDFEAIKELKTKAPGIGSTDLERRLFNLLPSSHINAYKTGVKNSEDDDIHEWYCRAHLIVDYIAGMTDDYALKIYQLLSGIKVN